MQKIKKSKNQIVIYQTKNGAIELVGDIKNETVWASRKQMSEIFKVNTPAISKHINNIYKEGELSRNITSSKMELVQNESGRMIKRKIDVYNLDILIAVGYRINSVVGTSFRQWATKTLRSYITEGYVLNKKRISKNYNSFISAVNTIQNILPTETNLDSKQILNLIKEFADTWFSLEAYDKEVLKINGSPKQKVKITAEEILSIISNLKSELIKTSQATEFFAKENKEKAVEGIVGNVMQTFNGKPVYKTIEEKAANLLYFMVKDHPFVDGNKRSGALSFIWFLKRNRINGVRKINPSALTAITLLVAESNPKDKDQLIALITNLLK